MKDIYTYILWLQVFANIVSVIVTFKIGRMKVTPTGMWFTLSASLFMALIYRLLKIANFDFIVKHNSFFNIFGDIVLLPLTALFIMIFTIQVYKTLKTRF